MGQRGRIGLTLLVVMLMVQPILASWIYPVYVAGAQQTPLYESNSIQPLVCYVNTGDLAGLSTSFQGSASQFIANSLRFGTNLTVSTGSASYNITVPWGEYGSSMIVLGVADDLSYPGSGGRVSLFIDTGHESTLVALRLKTHSYFDGQSSGIVWYRIDLEWSNNGIAWNYSTIFYNLSTREETIDTPFQVFFAKGRYVRINVTLVWTPNSGNTATGNTFLVAFIDGIVGSCYPYTPEAIVYYRIYEYYTSVNISLSSVANATTDYWYRVYEVVFPVNTSLALDTVNITGAPLSIGDYNLTLVLDENGNPLSFKVWDDGNISVVMPMISQNITLIYMKEGRRQGAEWLPPDGVVWFFDFGDAIEQNGTTQGWIGYGVNYQLDVARDPRYNDLSLHTLLQNNVYYENGGWYMTNLVMPPGDYYVTVNVLVDYSYSWFFGRIQLIFFFREYDGTYRSYYLINGRYTYLDTTLTGQVTAQKWGNQIYLTIRSYYALRNSQTWIRWVALVGVPSAGYNLSLVDYGHRQSNTSVPVAGVYYAILPWFNSTLINQFDSQNLTGYIEVTAGTNTSFTMMPETSINVTIDSLSGVDPNYAPSTLVAPPGSSIAISVMVSAPIPSQYIFPDPPLANTPVLFMVATPNGVYSQANATTNTTGYTDPVTLALPATPTNASIVVVPLAWPFTIPVFIPLYIDTVTVTFDNTSITIGRNSNTTIWFTATYTTLGLPFIGNISFTTSSTNLAVDSPVPTGPSGRGNTTIYSRALSGRYQVAATEASTFGLVFPASGSLNVIVTGAKIIINVTPDGPPWYIYSNVTWTVQAVYDDGSPALGTGYIVVEKDHYTVLNETWDGSPINITLQELGYDNYLVATLVEPDGTVSNNYSLLVAIPQYNTGNGSIYGGVELMSFTIETYQAASLKDGFIVILLIALTLAPYFIRRYTSLFKGHAGIIIWTAILLGATIVIMIGRSQIPVDAYIVQTENGTTIEPVYAENPFIQIYIAPIILQILVLVHETINIIYKAMTKTYGIGRW